MATRTSVATGNWSAAGTWDTGVPVVGTDNAIVAGAHTVTKDTALNASGDCVALTVNGTLAIGSNGLKCTSTLSGTGVITGGAGGALTTVVDTGISALTWQIVASSGSHFTLTAGGNLYIANGAVVGSLFEYADFLFSGQCRVYGPCIFRYCTTNANIRIGGGNDIYMHECALAASGGTAVQFYGGVRFVMQGGSITATTAFDCNVLNTEAQAMFLELHSIDYTVTTFLTVPATYATQVIAKSQAHDNAPGDWRLDYTGGYVLRSTASLKTQTYGIEFVPRSRCSTVFPVILEIPIPVSSGDTVAPSFYIKNVTADMDLEGVAGRMTFELDPGNEWGRYEKIDASALADPYLNWRQVVFTGGTAGGSAKKGTIIVRVTLTRYVATAVVYVADLNDGVP